MQISYNEKLDKAAVWGRSNLLSIYERHWYSFPHHFISFHSCISFFRLLSFRVRLRRLLLCVIVSCAFAPPRTEAVAMVSAQQRGAVPFLTVIIVPSLVAYPILWCTPCAVRGRRR